MRTEIQSRVVFAFLAGCVAVSAGMAASEDKTPEPLQLVPDQEAYQLLLVIFGKDSEAADLIFDKAARRKLARSKSAIVLFGARETFEPIHHTNRDAADVARAYGVELQKHKRPFIILVDGNNRLRSVRDVEKLAPETIVDVAQEWHVGKTVYDAHCARCHGPDGKDISYPFIEPLDGIGERMSLEEILDATWEAGFVSEDQFDEKEKEALARYIASL